MYYGTRVVGANVKSGDVVYSQVGCVNYEDLGKYTNGDLDLRFVETLIAGGFVYKLGPLLDLTVGEEKFQFRKVLYPTPGRYELSLERLFPLYERFERPVRRYVVTLTRYTLLHALDELIYPQGGNLSLANYFNAWQIVEARAGKPIVAMLRSKRTDAYSYLKQQIANGVVYTPTFPIALQYHPYHCFSQLAQSCVAADESVGRVNFETK
jgi:hypothetical protein